VLAFTGGRPGMISAATAAMAILMVTLVKVHGLQYLPAATLLTGVIQILFGFLRVGNLMRFVSKAVMAAAREVSGREINLLVMGAYGHSRVRNLILGSTTTHLIRTCAVPVVLFR